MLSLFIDVRGLNGRDIQIIATEPALDIKKSNQIRDGNGNLAVLECVVGSWAAPKKGEPITLILGAQVE